MAEGSPIEIDYYIYIYIYIFMVLVGKQSQTSTPLFGDFIPPPFFFSLLGLAHVFHGGGWETLDTCLLIVVWWIKSKHLTAKIRDFLLP